MLTLKRIELVIVDRPSLAVGMNNLINTHKLANNKLMQRVDEPIRNISPQQRTLTIDKNDFSNTISMDRSTRAVPSRRKVNNAVQRAGNDEHQARNAEIVVRERSLTIRRYVNGERNRPSLPGSNERGESRLLRSNFP